MKNTQELKQLHKLDITKITKINITTIGLLEIFGKVVLDIYFNDNTSKEFTFTSPVPNDDIIKWLEDNNLLELSTLKIF